MVEHLGKEAGSLLCLLRELHGLAFVGELDVGREALIGRGKVGTLTKGKMKEDLGVSGGYTHFTSVHCT